jgi:hypothetical protein
MGYLSGQKNALERTERNGKTGLIISGGIQQWQQTAARIERHQIITTTDMRLANENLRHSTSARNFHHLCSLPWIAIDADLFELQNASGLENLLGLHAVGADSGSVDFDVLHILNQLGTELKICPAKFQVSWGQS